LSNETEASSAGEQLARDAFDGRREKVDSFGAVLIIRTAPITFY